MSSDQKTILITGINGYIASQIGLKMLKKGYIVRGTSRSTAAEDHLLNGAFSGFDKQYQHFIVGDITQAGAFDNAVKGVHAIFHVASPVDFSLKSVDAFFLPAIGGVTSILKSTKLAGPQLESFVLTSSIAAIADKWKNSTTHIYSEADWNTSGEAVARENFSAPVAYGASKAAAERAMWEWRQKNNPPFSVSAVNPGVVMGPPVSWPATPDKLNETLMPIWRIFNGDAKTIPPQIGGAAFIDVRDVSDLHIWCAENPKQSNGQRYLATNGKAPPQAFADILRRNFPDRQIVEGTPGEGYTKDYWFPENEPKLVSTKAYKALGVDRFRSFEDTIMDTVEAFEDKWPSKHA